MKTTHLVVWLLAACASVAIAGCRHPCGYVDVRSTLAIQEGVEEVRPRRLSDPLRLVREPTAQSPVLEVVVERGEFTTRPARRETWGRPVHVPYQWYAAIIKPLAAVTLVAPLGISFTDPHQHNLGSWGTRDYFHDAIAWFNPFTAIPTGSRRVEEERRLRADDIRVEVSERRLPDPGRRVTLFLDDKELESAVSDADGRVRFDLAARLTQADAASDRTVRLRLAGAGESDAEMFRWTLKADLIRDILKSPGD